MLTYLKLSIQAKDQRHKQAQSLLSLHPNQRKHRASNRSEFL
jgi:hypothetical protein